MNLKEPYALFEKNPFQQIVHFNICNSILVFMKCCINVKFFWKTNFNLEAILPCNKPTPLYLPCLVVEDEGTSSISIVNWGSHSSLLQWYNIQRGGLESDPPVPKSWSKGEGSKQTLLKDWQDMEGSLSDCRPFEWKHRWILIWPRLDRIFSVDWHLCCTSWRTGGCLDCWSSCGDLSGGRNTSRTACRPATHLPLNIISNKVGSLQQ